MSRIGMVLALALAAALAVAAWVLLRQPPVAASGSILVFDPARVVEIHVNHPAGDRPPQAARRTDAAGRWEILLDTTQQSPADEALARPWPASATQVRAALRILSTLAPLRPADAAPDPASVVTLELDDGGLVQARVGLRPLAGQVIAESLPAQGQPARRGWVSAEIADMLTTGLGPWRDQAALPELGPDVARIALRGEAGSVALARVQGRWALREPVAEPADPDAITRLVSRLAALRITDFLDQGPPANAGLDAPRATLILEADLRDPTGQGPVTTRRTTLALGRAADVAGRTLYARISRSTAAEPDDRVVIVAADELAELTTDPAALIARRALSVPASEVGSIRLVTPVSAAERHYKRSIDGWNYEVEGLDAVRTLKPDHPVPLVWFTRLCDTPAAEVRLDPQARGAPLAAVTLATLGGSPLGRVEVVRVDERTLALRRDRVERLISIERFAELVRALEAGAGPE